MPSRTPKVRPTCNMVASLPIRCPRAGRTAIFSKQFAGSRLQPLMHHEELIILVEIGLWRGNNRAAVESDDHFPDLFYSEGDQLISQVTQRCAAGQIVKLISL